MNRDPFDEMKRRNPAPGDSLPGAPMAAAERILARRVRHGLPAWASAAVAAVSVAVIGFGVLWFLGDRDGQDVASGGSTTSTVAFSTTSAPPQPGHWGVVYYFMDTTGPGGGSGPFLVPVTEFVEGDSLAAQVEALFAGPTPDQTAAVPAISTAIPGGSRVLGVEYDGEIAIVDVSSEFVSGGGTLSMMGRLAQVVLTLDALEGVEGVRFAVEGVPTTVFGGEGVTLDDPATSNDFEDLLPAVMIENPAHGSLYGTNPLAAQGTANVFEATVSLALTDADGLIIWEGFATATCGTGCRGTWEVTIPYEVDAPQMGSLIAWEASAMDGSQTNVREHPVWLVPTAPVEGSPTTTSPVGCSGGLAARDLVDQPELPPVIAARRAAIFEAARACDWGALESLMADGFSYTFGVDEDPIARWQQLEAEGDQVMYYLAELLNRPFGIQSAGDETYYAWPSAFVTEWAAVPEADREALRPLYGDEDFAFWAEFGGYIGYRIGIDAAGSWVYFIAGD